MAGKSSTYQSPSRLTLSSPLRVAKLIASAREVELIAADDNADVPALRGWRRDIFGDDALRLKHGRLGLVIKDQKLALIDMGKPTGD